MNCTDVLHQYDTHKKKRHFFVLSTVDVVISKTFTDGCQRWNVLSVGASLMNVIGVTNTIRVSAFRFHKLPMGASTQPMETHDLRDCCEEGLVRLIPMSFIGETYVDAKGIFLSF